MGHGLAQDVRRAWDIRCPHGWSLVIGKNRFAAFAVLLLCVVIAIAFNAFENQLVWQTLPFPKIAGVGEEDKDKMDKNEKNDKDKKDKKKKKKDKASTSSKKSSSSSSSSEEATKADERRESQGQGAQYMQPELASLQRPKGASRTTA